MFSLLHHPLICRCCLLEQPPLYHSLHDASSHLATELKALAPSLRLDPGDNLTDVICELCLRRLHDARDFQRRCEHSEQELRSRHEHWKQRVEVGEVLALDDVLECLEREVGSLEGPAVATPLQPTKPVAYVAPLMESVDFENLDFQDNSPSQYEAPTFWQSTTMDAGSLNTPHHQPDTLEPFEAGGAQLEQQPPLPESPPPPADTKSSPKPKGKRTKPKAKPARPDNQKPKAVRTANSPRSLHPCSECEKKFTRNFQLKLHMTAVHGLGEMRYQCEECRKCFASRHSLRYHVKSVHSSERPFACQHCERRFVLRTQLMSHLRTHTGETKPRIFACTCCPKSWPTKSDLRTHMRSHYPNMERPFKCDRCSKAFFTRGHLNSHLLVHTGEKPFVCEYCSKCYQSVGNLNNHMVRQHADIIEAQLEMEEAIES